MMVLLWSLPALTVIAAIASGRVNTTIAAVLGLLATLPVALFAAPAPFDLPQLAQALKRGLWTGWIITPYILGGLLFWQMAAQGRAPADGSDWKINLTGPTPGGQATINFDVFSETPGVYHSLASLTSNLTNGVTQVSQELTVTP